MVYLRLAVRAESRKSLAVGAPLLPTFLIFSFEPALIRARLAAIFEYNPGLLIDSSTFSRRLSPWLLDPLPWLRRQTYGHKMTSYVLHPS
jgi:hypothetical protein